MPASYPSSAKTFTTKASNDTVEASHPNDLQAEITAIETALLGTLAHDLKWTDATYDIGKSGATRPRDGFFSRNFVIGGTAAVVGVLTATAQAIFTGGWSSAADVWVTATKKLFLDGGSDTYLVESAANTVDLYTNAVRALTVDSTQFIDSPTQPRCSAFHSTTQSINDSTVTALSLNSEDYDVTTLHDLVTANTKITVPTGGDGLYLITGQVTHAGVNTTGVRTAIIRKNGTTELAYTQAAPSATLLVVQVHTVVVLTAADYIELCGYQNSGGAANVGNATAALANRLQIVKLW